MYRVNDNRSMKIVICSHCILNQNAKLEGIAGWQGMIDEVIEVIKKSGAGILQMACPELLYEGIGRFDKSVEQYQCTAFRKVCRRIAREIVEQAQNYLEWGYSVPVILALDGSPSCGFNLTQSAPEWRGLVVGQNWQKVRYIEKRGVLMEILESLLQEKKLDIPILGIPEVPELGSIQSALSRLRQILSVNES